MSYFKIVILLFVLIFFSSCEKTYLYKISSEETTDIYVSDRVLSEEEKQEVLLNYETYLKKNYCRDTIVKTGFKTYRVKAKKDLTIKLLHHVQHHNYTFYVLSCEKQQ